MKIIEILVIFAGIPTSLLLSGILWIILDIAERIDKIVRKYHGKVSNERYL